MIGIEILNSVYLTHRILDPHVLTRYLEIIEDDLEEMVPEYEPVFMSVYQYYGNLLASFTNTIDDLLLQLPMLIELKVQVPMSLFCWMQRHIRDKREYTQIILETEYIALTDNNYVPLTQVQISLCRNVLNIHSCLLSIMTKKSKLKQTNV